MGTNENLRDTGTCLGGFLGMFLGAMFAFAVCMKYMVDKVARDDGSVHSNQALMPFVGVMAGACIGAVSGAILARALFALLAVVFPPTRDKH